MNLFTAAQIPSQKRSLSVPLWAAGGKGLIVQADWGAECVSDWQSEYLAPAPYLLPTFVTLLGGRIAAELKCPGYLKWW